MKKTYIQPQSAVVRLFAEEVLLSVSGGAQIEANKDKTTEVRWSQKQNDMWANMDKD